MKCGKGARRSSIAFSKAQHKTDGSHPNRPFSYRKQAAGETTGFHPPPSPAMPFISVLREKESAPFRKDRKPVPLAPNLCYNEASEVNSMARMRLLNALPAGATQFEGFCIIKSVSVRQNIKGTDYLDLVLADAEGEAVAKLWDYNRAVQGEYQAGDVVKVRSENATFFKTAAIVYILPLIFFLAGFALAYSLGAGEGLCVAASFLGLALGAAVVVASQRLKKNKNPITFDIVELI